VGEMRDSLRVKQVVAIIGGYCCQKDAQDRDRWQAVVNGVMNFQVP
jgi:hypothetical protein